MAEAIPKNPLALIKNFPVTQEEPDPFDLEELDRLINTSSNGHEQEINYLKFNAWTGLRPEEMIALAWEDVDLERGIVKVQRARVRALNKRPKTKSGERVIELLEPALEALRAQKAHSYMMPAITIEVEERTKKITRESIRHVFLNSNTQYFFPNDGQYRQRFFQGHCRKAGIRYRPPVQLRHTFASQMLSHGANPAWIAYQMGHADWAMIRKVYARWIPHERNSEVDRMNKMIGEKLNIRKKEYK